MNPLASPLAQKAAPLALKAYAPLKRVVLTIYQFTSKTLAAQNMTTVPSMTAGIEGITNFLLLKNVGAVTLGQVGQLAGEGVKIAGFACLGEIIGRRSVVGYSVGSTGGGHH